MTTRTARHRGWPLLGAEMALAALSVVTVLNMRRLFEDWSFAAPYLVAVLASHLTAAILRRLRWPVLASMMFSAVAMVMVIGALNYSETLWVIVPSFDTWGAVGTDLSEAWTAFGEVKAPAEVLSGFITAGAVALWALAFIADLAAFRIRTAIEAIGPAFVVFVFTAVLGLDTNRLLATSAFIVAAILFALFSRILHPLHHSVPITATRDRQPGAILRVGALLSVCAAAIGVVFGPVLPGVDAEAVVDLKELDGGSGGPRVTLSPLVDARGRLVEQSSLELFRVKAERPAYWRVSGLDQFNGSVWGSDHSYSEVSGALRPEQDGDAILEQEITITGLDGLWMPAAYSPSWFRGDGIIWDAESATFVARADSVPTGTTYRVRSAINLPTREELETASPVVPADILATYTALPADFNPRVKDLAAELTEGLDSSYQRALALQDFFLDNFTYSLDVDTGHDTDRMENFLFNDRRGYCEQFSGTFAAMARSIGLPTRVAVGFTPGERVGDEFIVRGENYHAWPEVWIDGRWVYFEPTPGRGAPGATQYTGVAEQQVVRDDPLEETGGLAPEVQGPQVQAPLVEEFFDDPGIDPSASAPEGGTVATWVWVLLAIVAAAMLIGGLWLVAMPALVRWRRRRRREAAAGDARQLVEANWADLVDSLHVAGVPRHTSETHHEFAERAASRSRASKERLAAVAMHVDVARFAPDTPDEAVVEASATLVEEIEADLQQGLSWQEKLKRRADPRTLVGSRHR